MPGVTERTATELMEKTHYELAEQELRFMERHEVRPLFFLDDAYPHRLKRCHDAPVMLYFKGNADLNCERVLAIVGTRKPSLYGIAFCERLVEGLKHINVLIISGLAYGIDITAHRSSLEHSLPTVGVMGHGQDMIYPPVHSRIASDMVGQGGLLTEFVSRSQPDREHFPMRNRIIAGLCDALVVVESDRKGGSMISADIANSYDRDVFAVPGKVGEVLSRGCHFLIRTHRAGLIEGPEDLINAMSWHEKSRRDIQRTLFVEMTEHEESIYALLSADQAVSIDRVFKETGLPASELASALLSLEFKGLIKPLPGKQYVKV